MSNVNIDDLKELLNSRDNKRKLYNNETTQLNKGLSNDTSNLAQPKGTYKYALNSVLQTDNGDIGFIANEEGNKEFTNISEGFVLIGKCYMIDNEIALFSVNPKTGVSEIGIMDDKGNYKIEVNDSTSPKNERLNFSQTHQIQATYRLRRGCEKNIYFTDGLNNPRYYNFNEPYNFKNSKDQFIASKFKIFKTLDKIPRVDKNKLQVLEGYGSLKPGSYTILVQYLDQDLNPTQYIELVNNIIIYNDSFNSTYGEIGGSMYISLEGEEYNNLKFENTNKGIKIDLDKSSINRNFTYIRYAFVEYNSGTGTPSKVVLTDYLPIENTEFIYTGSNGSTKSTIEEIQLFGETLDIETAQHIEQIDNRLLLANTKAKEVKYHNLQKYASKIKTDCKVKDVNLSSLGERNKGYNNRSNPKHPLINSNGVGYQPGEVYAFGIIYVFKDGRQTPVFHIPGKGPGEELNKVVYKSGQGIYPMSNKNNISTSIRYNRMGNCDSFDYWGKDCEGNNLEGKQVRFHRFPTREELGLTMIETNKKSLQSSSYENNIIMFQLVGNPKNSVICKEGQEDCTNYKAKDFTVELSYKVNGISKSQSLDILPDDSTINGTSISELLIEGDVVTDLVVKYYDNDNIDGIVLNTTQKTNKEYKDILKDTYGKFYIDPGIDYSKDDKVFITEIKEGVRFAYFTALESINTNASNIYSNIFGVSFSNIEVPSKEEIGEEIIGYQIVRLDREDSDATIIDTGVITPMSKYEKKSGFAGFTPEVIRNTKDKPYSQDKFISKDTFNIISLKHKFTRKSPDSTTRIQEMGRYYSESLSSQAIVFQDVMDGSSADGIKTTEGTSDDDGWSLKHLYRFSKVRYDKKGNNPIELDQSKNNKLEYRFYDLNSVEYAPAINEENEIINPSMDERALILNIKGDTNNFYYESNSYPYVYFYKDHKSFYTNFRNKPYLLCDNTVFSDDTCEVFGGDTYLSPLRVSSMNYLTTYQAVRRQNQSFWRRWFLPGLSIVLGALLLPVTGGQSFWLWVAAGALTLGGVVLGTASHVQEKKFREVYDKKWKEGLSKLIRDLHCQWMFVNPNQPIDWENQMSYRDDTIGWFTDSLGDIWLESKYNANLRVEPKSFQSYLNPQTKYPEHDNASLLKAAETYQAKIGQTNITKWKKERAWVYADPDLKDGKKEILLFSKKITKNKDKPTQKSDIDYTGIPIPTFYVLNPDYNYIKRLKYFYALPISYEYCSECSESFPHRIYYSEQSFKEEKTDNYTKFLPNNYRDVEGETGEITNIFKLNSNLYIHTEEGLWLMPRSYQERITDQIVSFIGTGSFFEVPPQKLIDDETGQSAGTRHKWASLKTPEGYFFVSENNNKIYMFDGKTPQPISDIGMSNWFENNLKINQDFNYEKINDKKYPFRNNPSNKNGSGFISTYDSNNDRIIFTKKDFNLDLSSFGNNFDIDYNSDNKMVVFKDIDNLIKSKILEGYIYIGKENGKLKFSKEVIKTRKEKRTIKENIFKDVDYILFKYNFNESNGRDLDTRTKLLSPIESPEFGWSRTSDKEGLVLNKYLKWGGDNTGYGKEMIFLNLKDLKKDFPDAKEVKFRCRAFWYSERIDGNMKMTAEAYKGGCVIHEGTKMNFCESIISNIASRNISPTRDIILPEKSKIKSYNDEDDNNTTPQPATNFEFKIVGGTLQGSYDFPIENIVTQTLSDIDGDDVGIFTYNIEKGELYWEGKGSGGHIPSSTRTIEIDVDVQYSEYEYHYINGEIIDDTKLKDYSWTISFSLSNKTWISFHSYKPNFYINIPDKIFSWVNGNNNIWLHNIKGLYQTYYNSYYPHIIEYISYESPIITNISNNITILSESKIYDKTLNSYTDDLYTTFNKAIIYNSRQCSGELTLRVKDSELYNSNYLSNQIINSNNNISIIDRTERNWNINDYRDIRVNYNVPIWKDENNIHIKTLNTDSLNINKDWTQLESFRDKYLGVRLIFDNFADRRLITNFNINNTQYSQS